MHNEVQKTLILTRSSKCGPWISPLGIPWELLEMQTFRLHASPAQSETLGMILMHLNG